ncbi:hypothetical protein CAI21_14825 [Alkalilimnicola ehrlichii]|uniref:Uncharacterized protein n=1 Tax=Alkalilimnicola ehrlichii TaxID=351052 RepID=A0A3E0WNN7_9GAMM|nr:hypothetical protein [Alkalilimnicola ehrlichii]RFA27310.1 hypothetical protein CAI21_14825 [Alkalilimnicola ehrlichii]RFA34418.1 hypothetical protein CAL65_15395 [Alkalilimnicola ehrlichii]
MNQSLWEGRYFFLDIKREGRVLIGSNIGPLIEPKDLPVKDRLPPATTWTSTLPKKASII